jgi:integrase
LTVLRQIEKRGRFDTAHRLRALIGEVFRRAVADGRAKIDPTPDLRDQLTTPTRTPHPAITKPDEFGGLLRAIDGYRRGAPETRLALQLLALTFVRPDELRWARWDEFDLGGAEATWTLPAERMKMRREHKVPLSRQAVEIVRELRALSRGGAFLFPGRTTARPMSESCLSAALHYMGIPKDVHCPHGFRSSFSSIANAARTPAKDADGRPLIPRRMWDSDAIELQSSRVNGGAVRRVYCREDFMAERREMMQWWANYLDTLRADVKMKEVA